MKAALRGVVVESKVDQVRSSFEQAEWYLRKAHNIRIRRETVHEFLNGVEPDSILDIGCGDGCIRGLLLPAKYARNLISTSAHVRRPRLHSISGLPVQFASAGS